jgi:hypothetical protein
VLHLTFEGAQQLLRTTTEHQGQRIGVLVNHHLVTVAAVRSAMTDMLPVVAEVLPEQASALAARIRTALQRVSR